MKQGLLSLDVLLDVSIVNSDDHVKERTEGEKTRVLNTKWKRLYSDSCERGGGQ